MERKEQRSQKGFSLVELIIVIAIMAVMVGVLSPSLIRYVEKAKVSADIQLADTVKTAVTTAMMDPSVISDSDSATVISGLTTATDIASLSTCEFTTQLWATINLADADALKGEIRSTHKSDSTFMIKVDGSKVSVEITGTDATGAKKPDANANIKVE